MTNQGEILHDEPPTEGKLYDAATAAGVLGPRYAREAAAIRAIGHALTECPDYDIPHSVKHHLLEGLRAIAEVIGLGPRHAADKRVSASYVMGELHRMTREDGPLVATLHQHLPALDIHFQGQW